MAGVKLVENLASFTDAYGTNKNFKKRDKVAKVNPWADAGSLSQDKYFDPDKTTGSYAWKGLLDDTNPDVRDNDFYQSAINILETEGVKFEPKAVAGVIERHFPDWRRVLNELQRYSVSGKIDAGILVDMKSDNIKELINHMKQKEFTNVRKWVVNNLDNDSTRLFRNIYDSLYDYVDSSSIPHVVVILGEYQYKAAFVADQEINTLACLTEIMARTKFK